MHAVKESIPATAPTPPDDNMDRIRALLSDLRASFPARLIGVPSHSLVVCDKHGSHDITLVVDDALLPAIPVRVVERVRCLSAKRNINAAIARYAEHMLYHARVEATV